MVNITIPFTGWMAPAELPPLPIGALMVGAAELLQEAADLPQPEYVTISVTEHIGLQFGPDRSSFAAITRWALRFGGVLTSDPYHDTDDPQTICSLEFSYFGVQVDAYAFIPAVMAAT